MTMYKFYSVIEPDEDVYLVTFPDIENCFTDGETLQDAVAQAEDVLCLMLYGFEEDGNKIPAPSSVKDIQLPDGASLVLIQVDTDTYR